MLREHGQIIDIYLERGVAKAEVDVGGAIRHAVLTLLMDAHVGDELIIEKDLAISHAMPEPSIRE